VQVPRNRVDDPPRLEMSTLEIVLGLALQLLGSGIQNHRYAPRHWNGNFSADGQHAVNQENLRHALAARRPPFDDPAEHREPRLVQLAPSPTRLEICIDAEARALDHTRRNLATPFPQQLGEGLPKHGRSDRRKKADAAGNPVSRVDLQDVDWPEPVVLVAFLLGRDLHVPTQAGPEDLSTQTVHLRQQAAMALLEVWRNDENAHDPLR